METEKKFNVEFKQTTKGVWYIGSVKINADSMQELDDLVEKTILNLHEKVARINKGEVKKAPVQEIILEGKEEELFQELRKARLALASEEGIPPYMISHDSVLKKFAKFKPMTKEKMLDLGGVKEKSFDKYGVHFLKVVRGFCLES